MRSLKLLSYRPYSRRKGGFSLALSGSFDCQINDSGLLSQMSQWVQDLAWKVPYIEKAFFFEVAGRPFLTHL